MMWGYDYGPYGNFGVWPMVGMILSWVIFGVIVIAALRFFRGGGHYRDDQDRSLEILRERYAKGEISKKEFEEMKKDLG